MAECFWILSVSAFAPRDDDMLRDRLSDEQIGAYVRCVVAVWWHSVAKILLCVCRTCGTTLARKYGTPGRTVSNQM